MFSSGHLLAGGGNGNTSSFGDSLLTDPIDTINEAFRLFPTWADGLP